MPFASYLSIDDVAHAHRIRCRNGEFVAPIPAELSAYFREELAFTIDEMPFRSSESAACESLIFPLLREVWKPHRGHLTLWSHRPIAFDDDLCGTPDYIVARRSPLGAMIFDLPYLLVVEAKKDDFERGWGQCLAAMVAARNLNDSPDPTLYGIATTGRGWEFGRLEGDEFTQDPRLFSLSDLDDLAGALHFVMTRCREQVTRQPIPTS